MSASEPSRPSQPYLERGPSADVPDMESALRPLPRSEMPTRPDPLECLERDVITSQVPVAVMLEAARVMNDPVPPADLGLAAALENASAAAWAPGSHTSHLRPARPLAADLGLEGLLEPVSKPAPKVGSGWWIGAAAAVLGLASLYFVRSYQRQSAAPAVATKAASAASIAVAASASGNEIAALGCVLEKPGVKLDDWAVSEVRPMLAALPARSQAAALPGRESLWLGYAQSHRHATGGELDFESSRLERSFGQTSDKQIFSVTPLSASGSADFHVERMGGLYAYARALDTVPPLRLGMNDAGLVLGPLDERAQRIWELPTGTFISVPEVASHSSGFTIAFRAGRTSGHLRLGLLTHAGKAASELAQIGGPDSEYGRPALASGPAQTVLAVSQRLGPDQGFALFAARADNGQLPLALSALELEDTSGAELTAPALAALPDGGFVLMWSQGTGPARQVRAQRLSSELVPLGSPLVVSDSEAAPGAATAGSLYAAGGELLAFYFLRRDDGHSLWAARLGCGGARPAGTGPR